MQAANKVFSIAELLEHILLSLPCDNVHQELSSLRTILTAQTTCRTWHSLVQQSTLLRKRLYLSTPLDEQESKDWLSRHAFPPARPNPWIPYLLLNQRSWGSAYPFDVQGPFDSQPSQPRYWIFSIELSENQYRRLPAAGPWRDMLVAAPSCTHFWYTRSFYELGSGRAPFVTHVDYNPERPKSQQRFSVHCPDGMTLGHICDAVEDLFEKYSQTKFVTIESVGVHEDIDLRTDQ